MAPRPIAQQQSPVAVKQQYEEITRKTASVSPSKPKKVKAVPQAEKVEVVKEKTSVNLNNLNYYKKADLAELTAFANPPRTV